MSLRFDKYFTGPREDITRENILQQGDLLMVLFGRNSESPVPVVAPRSPSDCFDAAIEACRIALKYRTQVYLLSDAYLANGSEPLPWTSTLGCMHSIAKPPFGALAPRATWPLRQTQPSTRPSVDAQASPSPQ